MPQTSCLSLKLSPRHLIHLFFMHYYAISCFKGQISSFSHVSHYCMKYLISYNSVNKQPWCLAEICKIVFFLGHAVRRLLKTSSFGLSWICFCHCWMQYWLCNTEYWHDWQWQDQKHVLCWYKLFLCEMCWIYSFKVQTTLSEKKYTNYTFSLPLGQYH